MDDKVIVPFMYTGLRLSDDDLVIRNIHVVNLVFYLLFIIS